MDLYPEGSTDGGLRLGNIVPDFSMETTHGNFPSFHEWKKGKWAILFSHPADFTPVCTTEIGRLVSTLNMIVGLVEIMLIWVDFSSLHQALKYDQLKAMDCLVATLSVDPVKSHTVSLLYHSFTLRGHSVLFPNAHVLAISLSPPTSNGWTTSWPIAKTISRSNFQSLVTPIVKSPQPTVWLTQAHPTNKPYL